MEDKIKKKIPTIINLVNGQTGVTEECVGIYDTGNNSYMYMYVPSTFSH